jgi:hypothetical protein
MSNALQDPSAEDNSYARQIYRAMAMIFSIAYAFVLASLPIDGFVDRDNYFNYITDASLLLESKLESGIATLLQNEPVWLLVNLFLGFFLEEHNALRVLIFFSAWLFSQSILRISKDDPTFFILAVVICLLPQVLKNYIIHLRQGLAIALLMFTLTSPSLMVRRAGNILTPLIHTSFLFVFINYMLSWLANKYQGASKANIYLAMLFVACLFNLSLIFLVGYSDARQITENASLDFEARSGMAFLFWLIILVIFLSDGVDFGIRYFFAVASIVGYLLLYFLFSPIARIFESAMPFVLVTGYGLQSIRRQWFYLMLGVLFCYQWLSPILAGQAVFRAAF